MQQQLPGHIFTGFKGQWLRFQSATAALARLQTRIVLAVVYLLIVLPTGLLFRLISRHGHSKHLACSGWIKRDPSTSMERPF